jgi:FkbM family methyltransferase
MITTLKLLAHKLIYSHLLKPDPRLVTLGNAETWTLVPSLNTESFVISGGAGHDISFELELIELCGCPVVLLDPSLPGATTIENLVDRPRELIFLRQGLAADVGNRFLSKPEENEDKKSWQISESDKGIKHSFTSLQALLDHYNKKHIDFLKIDIEGFEYEVIEQILRDKISITQICVEIHQGQSFGGKTRKDRWALINKMLKHGYTLIHHKNWDHTFYKYPEK